VFLEKLLQGLSWGLFFVSVLIPVLSFSVAWSWLGPILRRPKEDLEELEKFVLEDPPDLPEPPELPELPKEKPPPRYRFVASTIVRPPKVIRREDKDED
jgi:hypothetical protein